MAKKDAIQQDVSGDETEDDLKPTPANNPRNAHMDAITTQAREQREKEMGEQVFEGDEITPEITPEPEPELKKEPEPKPAPKVEPEPNEDDEELETLKIDGKEVKVPKSKVYDTGRRAMQKEIAADRNLHEAKQIRAEAERLMQEAEQGKQHSQDANQNEKLSEIASKLQFGSEEEGKAALAELLDLTGASPKEVDVNAITTQVAQQVQERQEWQNASDYVSTEYSDVMDDPVLMHEFQRREDEARANGDERSYRELYVAIAEDLRNYRSGLSPTAKADTLEDRRRRKAESAEHVGGHTAQHQEAETVKPRNPQDIIAEMRKARRQS